MWFAELDKFIRPKSRYHFKYGEASKRDRINLFLQHFTERKVDEISSTAPKARLHNFHSCISMHEASSWTAHPEKEEKFTICISRTGYNMHSPGDLLTSSGYGCWQSVLQHAIGLLPVAECTTQPACLRKHSTTAKDYRIMHSHNVKVKVKSVCLRHDHTGYVEKHRRCKALRMDQATTMPEGDPSDGCGPHIVSHEERGSVSQPHGLRF